MDVLDELRKAGASQPPSAATLASVRATILREAPVPAAEPAQRHGIRHRLLASVAAFALVGGGSAVAWATATYLTDPTTTTTIECGANTYIPEESGHPVLDCRNALAREGGTVPPLVGWVTPSGLVAVLPMGERAPEGSTRLPTGFEVNAGVRYLTDALGDAAGPLQSRCLTTAAATQWVDGQLAVAGLAGWSVRVDAPGDASCGAYAGVVDASATAVVLRSETFVDPRGNVLDVEFRLGALLRTQTASGASALCLSTPTAMALAARDAANLGIARNAIVISDAGTIGAGARCATSFVESGGSIGVVLWQAPRT